LNEGGDTSRLHARRHWHTGRAAHHSAPRPCARLRQPLLARPRLRFRSARRSISGMVSNGARTRVSGGAPVRGSDDQLIGCRWTMGPFSPAGILRQSLYTPAAHHDPRQEPYAVVLQERISAGDGEKSPPLPRPPLVSPHLRRGSGSAQNANRLITQVSAGEITG